MKNLSFNNVLFVGTGGGNDVFSTTLAMSSLWQLGWRWKNSSIAGILSPFHRHTYPNSAIPGLFKIKSNSQRFLLRYDDPRQIGFIDAKISEMIQKEKFYKTESVFGLSIKSGTRGLSRSFKQLSVWFDYIILVDVGGDCFYNGDKKEHILSPMFDAVTVRAFVDSGAPGILFEAGPGTDGELSPKALKKALMIFKAKSYPLTETSVNWWEKIYSDWIENIRPGRTVPKTIEAFRSEKNQLEVDYRARAHIGRKKYYKYFKQIISTALCKRFYLVEPKLIKNPFAVSCSNPMDWFVKTQIKQHHTNNEANLEYLPVGNELWQFLTPSPLFESEDRIKIIKQALSEFERTKVCDGAWLLTSDLHYLPAKWRKKFQYDGKNDMIEVHL